MHLRMLIKLPRGREDSEASWKPTHQVACTVVGLQTSVRRMIKAMSDGVRSSVMKRICEGGLTPGVPISEKKKILPGISRGRMHIRCMRLRAELGVGPVILHLHAGSSSLPIGA